MSPDYLPELFYRLTVAYGERFNNAPDQERFWLRVLADVPDAAVGRALDRWERDPEKARFVPVPADLLGMARASAAARDGKDERPVMIHQVWSAAIDGYVRLPQPRPYREELDGPAARDRRFAGEVLPGDPVPEKGARTCG